MNTIWIILLCGVASMVLGFVWFGPLFGGLWSRVIGADKFTIEERKKMQASAGKLYVVAFALSLVQAYVLTRYSFSGTVFTDALWLWAGFSIPVVAGDAMWNTDSTKVSWTRFLLQAGYYLVLVLLFACLITIAK